MIEYLSLFQQSFVDYAQYLKSEILNPHWGNYFYWIWAISIFFWLWEIGLPWRKAQKAIRKDFWLDGFYIFFNMFLFSLVGYYAISNVAVALFNDGLGAMGIENLVQINLMTLPAWAQLLILFLVLDFTRYFIHQMFHRVPWLWEVHKIHHSVKEMGFAAHFRFHWVETVAYRTIEYIPLAMIGFGISDFLLVHLFTIVVGHFSHSNIRLPLPGIRFIVNNPQLHIWHHSKKVPNKYGVNFGLTLCVWDYLFGTAYEPHSGRDIPLGFQHEETFPQGFTQQFVYPFTAKKPAESD